MQNNEIKIMIVENDEVSFLVLKYMLEEKYKNKFNIIRQVNGIEQIEKYKESLPEIIFMDIHMDKMGGIDQTKKIRELENKDENINKSHIIAYTADVLNFKNTSSEIIEHMDDYISKPIEYDRLEESLKKNRK